MVSSSVTLSSISWHSIICLLPTGSPSCPSLEYASFFLPGLGFLTAHVPLLLCA